MPYDLIGVPPRAEVWLVDNNHYLIYHSPFSGTPLGWWVPNADERTALGITAVDRTLTQDQFRQAGVLRMGNTTEIPNAGLGVHPFDTLVGMYETESQVKPWLLDPEIMALWAGAAMEGRSITPAEMQTTDWWKSHDDAERRWLSLNASDPSTAQTIISDNRLNILHQMEAMGIANAPADLINFVADRWTRGEWSQAYAMIQIQGLSDPFARVQLDPGLTTFRQNLDTTRGREDEVRAEINRWLGPAFSQGWDDNAISEWAGALRNNPDALTELVENLKGQRLALFPEYTNPNLTYDDIAAPWRGVVSQIWGQTADESDPMFARIVRLNDLDSATTILRQEGVKRGNGTVVKELLNDVGQAFGGQIRPVGGFR